MFGFKRVVIAIAVLVVFAAPAGAGVLLVNSQSSATAPGNKEETRAYIADHGMRLESSASTGAVVFRSDKKVLWIIDEGNKTATEITQEDLLKIAEQVHAATKEIEKQMENMPASQRAMMARMMKGRMPMAPEPTLYEKTGAREKINTWMGEKYVGTRKGEKETEVWTASADQLGISASDMGVMLDMAAFFRELSDRIGFTFYQVGSEDWEHGYAGIPIRMIHYVNGQPGDTSELVEVRKQAFDPALFELPAGYTKKRIPVK